MTTFVMSQPWLWKRFYTNAIDSYVAAEDEPIFDMRGNTPILRIGDGVTAGGVELGEDIEASVATPTIQSPANGSTDIGASPVLTSSPFQGITAELTADTHVASFWEVATDNAFSNIVHSSNRTTTDLIQYDLSAVAVTLAATTQHFVRVRHESGSGIVSEWSPVSSFTTTISVPQTYDSTLTSPSPGDQYYYGFSVTLSGNGLFAVVGESGWNAKAGRVHIYEKQNGIWTLVQTLTEGTESYSYYGDTVAISDDGMTVAIGHRAKTVGGNVSAGALHVYRNSGSGWVTDGGTLTGNSQAGGEFSLGLALSGDGNVIVAGGPYINTTGRCYVFRRDTGSWTYLGEFNPTDTDNGSDKYGHYIALNYDGSAVAISAEQDQSTNAGAVYYSDYNGTNYNAQLKITYAGTVRFGSTKISLSGDGLTLVIGETDYSGEKGRVYVYVRTAIGEAWGLLETLTASDGQNVDRFGASAVNYDGSVIVVGAAGVNVGAKANVGAVYVYIRNPNSGYYAQQGILHLPDALAVANDPITIRNALEINAAGSEIIAGAYLNADTFGAVHFFN